MALLPQYNNGQNLTSQFAAAAATFGATASAVNTAGKLSAAITNAYSSSGSVLSAIRSINLPAAGEAVGDIASAVSLFSGDADPNDWRVRLSLPTWPSFRFSPVLKPLKDAGGLIFPYTPRVTVKASASYTPEQITHNNYSLVVYKNSNPGTIQIDAPMNVEDSDQALYWVACLHYLRSVTKMFSGYDPKAGNPPPIVFLNGYGNYVFKNIPVVVTGVDVSLPNDCDYISTEVVGSMASNIAGAADSIGGLASTLGGSVSGLSGLTSSISSIAGGVGQVGNILGSYNVGGSVSGGYTYVPTKSSFTVTLQPVYSRTSIRQFSLDQFVTGGYLFNYFGYI